MPDPSEQITRWFPRAPYNFDAPLPDGSIGPLKAAFTAVGQRLDEARTAIAQLAQQITLQTATGAWLRNHAVGYGVIPIDGETDDELRQRCLDSIPGKGLTIPDIQALVQQWYDANFTTPPTVEVLDLQSQPSVARAAGLKRNEFLINVTWSVLPEYEWFLDYAYLDYTTYLGLTSGPFTPPPDLGNLLLTRWKSAGFRAIWQQILP